MATKTKALLGVNVGFLAQFLGLASLATILPFYIHLQWLTGPIVNAILILALFILGIRASLLLCLIPSLMALAGGLLPAVLAPAVPFIMIGNVILVLAVDWFYRSASQPLAGYWQGVIAGAILKFGFLFFSVSMIAKLLIKKNLAIKIAQMMSWPQLATALAGGLIAWLVLKWLRKI